jgi:hypothetical protein
VPHLVVGDAPHRRAEPPLPCAPRLVQREAAPSVSLTHPSTAFSTAIASSERARAAFTRSDGTRAPARSAKLRMTRACRTSSRAARRARAWSRSGAPCAESSSSNQSNARTDAASRYAASEARLRVGGWRPPWPRRVSRGHPYRASARSISPPPMREPRAGSHRERRPSWPSVLEDPQRIAPATSRRAPRTSHGGILRRRSRWPSLRVNEWGLVQPVADRAYLQSAQRTLS